MVTRSRTAARSSDRWGGGRVGRRFFDRPTTEVARDLLGRALTVRVGRRTRSVRLVETEAYVARDPANHAYRGPTPRNRSMFLEPGTLYVYRIHQVVCANVVTRPGEAVLLRAGAPLTPGMGAPSGPGRLCRALGIVRSDDGRFLPLGDRIWLSKHRVRPGRIVRGRRVGLRKAAERRLRFAIAGDPWVSSPRPERD